MSMQNLEQEIREAKKEIESLKIQKAQAEARYEQAKERLKKDFGFDSIEEAKTASAEMETKIQKAEMELQKSLEQCAEKLHKIETKLEKELDDVAE